VIAATTLGFAPFPFFDVSNSLLFSNKGVSFAGVEIPTVELLLPLDLTLSFPNFFSSSITLSVEGSEAKLRLQLGHSRAQSMWKAHVYITFQVLTRGVEIAPIATF
jgi:hypothetical protein